MEWNGPTQNKGSFVSESILWAAEQMCCSYPGSNCQMHAAQKSGDVIMLTADPKSWVLFVALAESPCDNRTVFWPGFISLSAPGGQNSGKVLPNSCALSIGAVRWWQGEEYPERFLPQFLLQRLIPFCFSEFLLPAGLKKLSGQFRLLSKLTGTFPGLRCSELQERNVIFKEKSNVWILHTECNLYQYKWRQPIWFYCQSTRERLFGSTPRAPTAKCLLSKSAEQ